MIEKNDYKYFSFSGSSSTGFFRIVPPGAVLGLGILAISNADQIVPPPGGTIWGRHCTEKPGTYLVFIYHSSSNRTPPGFYCFGGSYVWEGVLLEEIRYLSYEWGIY